MASNRHSEIIVYGVLLTVACLAMPTFSVGPTLETKTCPSSDYLVNGICCNKCHAGFKLVKDCVSEDTKTTCMQCPKGQFINRSNYSPTCFRCKTCKEERHEVTVSECKHYRDTQCRCNDTFYANKINSETIECLKCTTCSPDDVVIRKCTPETNTMCRPKENFRPVDPKSQLCDNCTDECKHLCTPLPSHKDSESGNGFLVHILIAAVVVTVVLLMLIICYLATKRLTKMVLRKPRSQKSNVSLDSEKSLIQKDMTICVPACPESALLVTEPNLPDCVPPEIKTHDLIYSVLDLVPVQQIKQLVRSLGVPESVIQWAEQDHKSKEAHYQMLKAWAEDGSHAGGGQGGMLNRASLQELMHKLNQMHLGGVAEGLETKYGIH
nr:tumor necrosis factor receptor superfamily member 1A [Nerophis lumbriciformis]